MAVKHTHLITKIYLLLITPLIFGLFVFSVSFWADREIQSAEKYRKWTNEILHLSMKLNVIGFDVISFPDEVRPQRQWLLVYNKMMRNTNASFILNDAAGARLKKIQVSLKRLNDLYSNIITGRARLNDSLKLKRTKRATKRLLFEVNLIVTEASLLNEVALQNKSAIYPRANLLMALVGMVSLVLFLIVLLILKRSILNPLSQLKTWSHELAEGDLSNRIELKRDDELGLLAADFNKMADNLQQSIKALENEVTERKQAEILLKQTQVSLSDANENLELRIEERTAALEEAVLVAEKANKSKSLFLANISHELRTPMHGILGFSSLGISRTKAEKREKLESYFDIINTSGSRLLLLLNDLLDLAKLESGKMTIDRERCDLKKMIESSIAEQRIPTENKKLDIQFNIDESVQSMLCDPARMQQVIANLLSNAIKFSDEETLISINVVPSDIGAVPDNGENESAQRKAVRLEVIDQGMGIPENELLDVFDKFIQSTKTDVGSGGTGLGLAICKEIVESHQGEIWAENHAHGAIFIVLLPLYESENEKNEVIEANDALSHVNDEEQLKKSG